MFSELWSSCNDGDLRKIKRRKSFRLQIFNVYAYHLHVIKLYAKILLIRMVEEVIFYFGNQN